MRCYWLGYTNDTSRLNGSLSVKIDNSDDVFTQGLLNYLHKLTSFLNFVTEDKKIWLFGI